MAKSIFLFGIFLIAGFWLMAQSSIGILLPKFPMRYALVSAHGNDSSAGLINYFPGVKVTNINASNDSIFAITSGTIISVNNDPDMTFCIIRNNDYDYVYIGMIHSKNLSAGSVIKGRLLGHLKKEESGFRMIVYRGNRELDFNETVLLLSKHQ